MLTTGLLLLTGTVYEAYQSAQDMKSYTPPGRLYEVSARNMHLYSAGKGSAAQIRSATTLHYGGSLPGLSGDYSICTNVSG